jgi:signal transduction histidine kinase
MAKLDPTKFRVSSALKTIIGKELITNDFIAVFELVKNSFDAHATRVDVIFEHIYGDNPKLIIKDNGKGMDLTDIVEKWLFVAYSAKKEGTEDEDYRDKIQSQRIHAGAKGIGRFSCDKLGKSLVLYTRKKDSEVNKLLINWEDFEKDSQKEFYNIKVKHSYIDKVPYENFTCGTVLEISGLRECWDRSKLLKLKHSLEKLINPNQENDPKGFSVYLNVPEEMMKDADSKGRDIVNGRIENKVFESLGIKTTKIEVAFSADGESITTTLEDRGTLIYRVLEENPYKVLLKDINIYLFVLNRSAKNNFTRLMGIPAVQYGSVFLYKNGFRIYPFGEPGEDTLKIDHRKQQGQARFLGTRDLIGRIEINGKNDVFQETSSRDGGLIRNAAYEALEEYLKEVLKRLEKFAIGVIKWGNDRDLLDHDKLSPQEMKEKASDIVYNLARSESLIDIEYSPKLIDILKDRTENSLKTILNNFGRVAEQTDSPFIAKEIRRAQRQFDSLVSAKQEAEAEAEKAQTKAKKAGIEAEEKISQNLFLQSVLSRDREDMLTFFHQIGISANTILKNTIKLLNIVKSSKHLPDDTFTKPLQVIDVSARMIKTVSNFATHANFNVELAKIKNDLVAFIKEYLLNICADQYTRITNIQFVNVRRGKFVCHFKPIEITIILDNLLQNSQKAGAKSFVATVKEITDNELTISFSDNGKGILSENIKRIFELGFTTTEGSGIGLYHVEKIVKGMQGRIAVESDNKGTVFEIKFRRK